MPAAKPLAREIRLTFSTIDRFRETRTFKTLKGARAYAHKRVGAHPEISTMFGYAVGGFGDAKLTVRGATFAELFPGPDAKPVRSATVAGDPEDYAWVDVVATDGTAYLRGILVGETPEGVAAYYLAYGYTDSKCHAYEEALRTPLRAPMEAPMAINFEGQPGTGATLTILDLETAKLIPQD